MSFSSDLDRGNTPFSTACATAGYFGGLFYFVTAPFSYFLPPLTIPGLALAANPMRLAGGILMLCGFILYAYRFTATASRLYQVTAAVSGLLLMRTLISLFEHPADAVVSAAFMPLAGFASIAVFRELDEVRTSRLLRIVISSAILLAMLAVGVQIGVIPVPSWREDALVFGAERSAGYADGGWGLIAATFCLIAATKQSIHDRLLAYCGLLAACTLILSGAFRTYLFTLGAAIIVFFLLRRGRAFSLIPLAVIVALVVVADPTGVSAKAFERVADYFAGETQTLELRSFERELTLQLVADRPITGHGPGVYALHVIEEGVTPLLLYGHNWYLDLPLNYGIPIAGLVVTVVFAFAWQAWWLSRWHSDDALFAGAVVSVFLVAVAGLAQNLFTMSTSLPAFALLWGHLLGAASKHRVAVESVR